MERMYQFVYWVINPFTLERIKKNTLIISANNIVHAVNICGVHVDLIETVQPVPVIMLFGESTKYAVRRVEKDFYFIPIFEKSVKSDKIIDNE